MKKKIIFGVVAILLSLAGFIAWKFFGQSVQVPQGKYFFIRTGETLDQVKTNLAEKEIIGGTAWFNRAADMIGYKAVKPGRYEVSEGMNLVNLVRMLKNGRHSPVNFVITKFRTKEVLASRVGRNFECDSLAMIGFLNNPDSLSTFGLDTNTVMAAAMPYTYSIRWNTTPGRIFRQFHAAYKTFWTEERKQKADSLGITPLQVSTLASIIDEETNAPGDRPNVASVYLNRLRKGMPLQADPTVKFAMRNFGLRRILNTHLAFRSPYNTYLNKGLPPGPICTPAIETIEAVLNAPKTEYLYFVANSALDGTHIFTTNFTDHLKYARLYQQELNKRNIK